MVVIALKRLRLFWLEREDAELPLRAWYAEARRADWSTPMDVKARYPSASILGNNRVVFNIGGNKYRLVAVVHYRTRTIYIRFIGTHREYDAIDASKV